MYKSKRISNQGMMVPKKEEVEGGKTSLLCRIKTSISGTASELHVKAFPPVAYTCTTTFKALLLAI
jgi:hypothetical protein